MTHRSRVLPLLGALSLTACKEHRPEPRPAPSLTAASSAAPSSSVREPTPPPSARSSERDEVLDASADASTGPALELSDVGPAAPVAATAFGVVLVSRDDELLLLPLPKAGKNAFATTDRDAGAFAPFARGPAVVGDFAYWVSKGRLVSRKLSGGSLEVLADDARDGTRVAAAKVGESVVAAYIARPESDTSDATAKLWVVGEGTRRLSPEGSAASSVGLLETARGALAFTLEGRTGMTPIHARTLSDRGNKVALDDDVVVWVGGSAQSLTEVVAAESPAGDAWAFVAMERDITRFGLAAIRAGEKPKMGAPVLWRVYPNGLDPAPIASAKACDESWLLYVRPAEAKPGAPQELHLAKLGADGLGPSEVVARSRAFSNVSAAGLRDGVLVAYTADHRTWATRTHCTKK